jgi:hypothetical protein
MQPLTNKRDVEAALLRQLTASEDRFIGRLIELASSRMRAAFPGVDVRLSRYVTDPTSPAALNPDAVSAVVAGAIKRYLVNIDGAASTSRTDGPFSTTVSFASYGKSISGGTQGELVITADDVKSLQPITQAQAASFRIRPALAPRTLERGRRGHYPSC